jgi:hypothetical protein
MNLNLDFTKFRKKNGVTLNMVKKFKNLQNDENRAFSTTKFFSSFFVIFLKIIIFLAVFQEKNYYPSQKGSF